MVKPRGVSGRIVAGADGAEPAMVSEAAVASAESADCVDADGVVKPCGVSDRIVAGADGAEPAMVSEAAVASAEGAD